MALLPKQFTRPSEGAISSYTFTEALSGRGIVRFYFVGAGDSAAQEWILTSKIVFGDPRGGIKTACTTGTNQINDIDFDIDIEKPVLMEGDAFANVVMDNYSRGSAPGGQTHQVEVKIRKWDGSTETEIASNTSDSYSNPVNSRSSFHYHGVKITVPKTFLTIGDTLRVTLITTASESASQTNDLYLGLDPQNTAVNNELSPPDNADILTGTTASYIDIPFIADF